MAFYRFQCYPSEKMKKNIAKWAGESDMKKSEFVLMAVKHYLSIHGNHIPKADNKAARGVLS